MSGYSKLMLFITFLIAFATISAQGVTDKPMTDLSKQIIKEMGVFDISKVAVVDFCDLDGNVNECGKFLAEELTTKLYSSKKKRVVERTKLNKIIEERDLNVAGIIEPPMARELGKLLGADAIISGNITDLDESIRVNARIINTLTGEVFAVAATDILKDASIIKLLAKKVTKEKEPDTAPVKLPEVAEEKTPVVQEKPEPVAEPEVVRVMESDDVRYKIIDCKVSNRTVELNMQMTNLTNDAMRVGIYANYSEVYDNLGNKYNVSNVQIGKDKSSYRLTSNFLPDVPVNVTLYIDSFAPDARSFTISIKPDKKPVVFRDILLP